MAETSNAEYLANQAQGALDEGDGVLTSTMRDADTKFWKASMAYQRANVLALLSVGERIAELMDVIFEERQT